MKTQTTLTICTLALLFFACQTGPEEPAAPAVELQCEPYRNMIEAPNLYGVFAQIDQQKIKIGECRNCRPIPPDSLPAYHMPDDARSALGGTEGNRGHCFYADNQKDTVTFHFAFQTDSAAPLHYHRLARYYDHRLYLLRPATKDALVGAYTYESDSLSIVLFIGLRERNLQGEYFQVAGPLPPEESLTQHLPFMSPQSIDSFQLDMTNLTLESAYGPGAFYRKNGVLTLELRLEEVLRGVERLRLKRMGKE